MPDPSASSSRPVPRTTSGESTTSTTRSPAAGVRAAGADVVFAPGISTAEQITRVVEAVDVPVNVLVLPGVPPIAELAELGVARISVGGGFALAAYGALAAAARELLEQGTYGFWEVAAAATKLRAAFD